MTDAYILRYALAAVLRALPEPWPARDVQRAVIATILTSGQRIPGGWYWEVRLAISHQILHIDARGWSAGPDVGDAPDDDLDSVAAAVVAEMLAGAPTAG